MLVLTRKRSRALGLPPRAPAGRRPADIKAEQRHSQKQPALSHPVSLLLCGPPPQRNERVVHELVDFEAFAVETLA